MAIAVIPLAVLAALIAIESRLNSRGDPLVALLCVNVVLLVSLTVWLGRRVLGSTAALEASRAELAALYEAAKADSLIDGLTGLGNHRAFQEEFARQEAIAARRRDRLALLLIDIDEFKRINDSRGHAGGDAVLAQIGSLLRGSIRGGSDRAFRVGGDEFAVLMPGTDEHGAYALGRRLLAEALRPTGDRPVTAFSGGVSAIPSMAKNRDELHAQADAALYAAKRDGRTRIELHDPQRQTLDQLVSIGHLSSQVAAVAEGRELTPVFQPIIELATGRIMGYEGLVRVAPQSGFSDPGSLFAAAERVGRTYELDMACLEVVAAGASDIPADRLVSMNISPRTLETPEFSVQALVRMLEDQGLRPGRTIIELTERQGALDIDELRRRVAALRETGIRVAADDVGAGNAGLRLLSQIHFDVVKVDLSLVQDGATGEQALDVLRSIAALAGRWEALVVAEGVETPEQLRMVRAIAMDAAQGFLLGRPETTIALKPVDLDGLQAPDYWLRSLVGEGAGRPTRPVGDGAARPTRPVGVLR